METWARAELIASMALTVSSPLLSKWSPRLKSERPYEDICALPYPMAVQPADKRQPAVYSPILQVSRKRSRGEKNGYQRR